MNEKDSSNGRTHEPSLKELTADLDGLRELFDAEKQSIRDLMDERDRRYEEKFVASEKLHAVVATAADRAVTKAEAAQSDYNVRSNEFRGQLDDQAKLLMPRNETDQRFGAMNEKIETMRKEIDSLRDSRSEGTGRRAQAEWSSYLIFAVLGLVVGVVTAFLSLKALK